MSLVPYVHLDAALATANAGDRIPLTRDEAHHLRTVLRLTAGAAVEVADGHGRHATARLGDGEVELDADVVVEPPPTVRLTVAQALPKGRKLDEVVRQVTELGVDTLVPVAAERSVVTLGGDRARKQRARWAAVARAASEQSRRPSRPRIDELCRPAELRGRFPDATVLVAHPGGGPLPASLRDRGHLVVAIGPEGGWTDVEVAAMTDGQDAAVVGLGPYVLRTEHAAAAVLATCAWATGRWG
ncbi:16S rRNA (uracil(1498)-N(3))-methyltransferase [Nitriliruptoraceae bacterium ZYF776]|nr:16S rRNA (uracil(1498)-N(3))-methyltransferase [Profundirhabdus halotolerans]